MFIRPSGMRKLESKCISCIRESRNEHDRYAVAVVKDGVVVRHLPKPVLRISSLLLRKGGRTTQEVGELQVLSNGIILKLISSF